MLEHLKNHLASTATITTLINHNSREILPRKQQRSAIHLQEATVHHKCSFPTAHQCSTSPRSYEKLRVEVDELRQPSRMKQYAEVLSAPFPAFSLPCLVGEEGTYVPLVTAALYVCATNGRSWDADSRISLAGSILPSSLPSRERLAGEVISLGIKQL